MSTEDPRGEGGGIRPVRGPSSVRRHKEKKGLPSEGPVQLDLSTRAHVKAVVDQLVRDREGLKELILRWSEWIAAPGRLVRKETYEGAVVEAVHDRVVVMYAVGDDHVEQTYELSEFPGRRPPAEGTRFRVQVEVYELRAGEAQASADEIVQLTDESIAEAGGVPCGRCCGGAGAGGASHSPTDGTIASRDVEFEQFCQEALQEAGDISTAQRDAILADLRLRFEHPGEYVAYIDRYPIRNKIRRLSRQLIAVGPDLAGVKAAYADFPGKKRAQIELEYLAPLSNDFQVLHDLPFR